MRTLSIIGDPGTVAGSLNRLHIDNPKMKVICHSCGPYFMQAPPSALIQRGHQQGQIPVHVLYVTYESPGPLVDAAGKVLEFQNENPKL